MPFAPVPSQFGVIFSIRMLLSPSDPGAQQLYGRKTKSGTNEAWQACFATAAQGASDM